MNLKNRCASYKISRDQRESEMLRGLGKEGTEGFQRMGCYECKGYDKECRAYYVMEENR